jgi:uncharacterized membrane protein YdfJ with MMPL/SSD domain
VPGTTLFDSLGCWIYRRRRPVLAAWLAALLVLAPLAPRLQGSLASGGFIAQGSEAVRASEALQRAVPARPRSVLLVVARTHDLAGFRAAVSPAAHLAGVTGPPRIVRASNGRAVYALFGLSLDPDVAKDEVDRFRDSLRPPPGMRLYVTGPPAVYKDIETATARDLRGAETIGIPAALVVLVLAFGTAVAAGIPLAVGGVAVLSTLGVLFLVAQVVPLSIFVLNIATMLGLGVGVDYALLAVSRFREELRSGGDVEQAVRRTVATAGRAIAFSGVAVLIGLSGLWVFGLRVLSSMAVGGSLVVATSALAAVTLLPALLGIVGPRIERAPVLPKALRGRDQGRSGWARLAAAVMARPWPFIAVTLGVVAVLAAPALSVTINVPRADVLPAGYDSRIGERILDRDFSQAALNPIVVFAPGQGDPAGLARRLAALQGVSRLAGVQRGPGGTVIDLVPAASPFSSAARDLVRRIRSLPGHGSRFLVTGQTAGELDFLDQIRGRAPWAVALIFAVTYAVLFAAFRSVLLPLKAIVMNTLSIAGSFGVLVWVFQDGHMGAALGVSKLGYVESTLPVVIFCVLFGISMDYEVFMLSRIAERHRAGAETPAAVAQGLVATGRIITSAAAIVVVIGLSFAFTGVVIVKELGLGLALAIFLDATLIRSLLVPATMRVLGEWNWWPGGRG